MNQIIKGAYLLMYNAAILARENATLCRANEKIRQKRTQSNRRIAHKGDIIIADGLQLTQQLEQPVEDSQVVANEAVESGNQADLPRRRAPKRYSGCGEISHKITRCNKR